MGAVVDRPDGARVSYEVAGDPRRDPLVLLGGVGGERSTWRHVVPHLARETFVVVVEPRGIGASEAPDAPTTVTTYADDTIAVLDELRLRSAHLYGHSLGALVAMEIALVHPDRVRSLILGAGRPGLADAVVASRRAPLGRPWEALYSARFLEEHPDLVDADRRAVRRRHGAERRQGEAASAWDPGARLAALEGPVLILHGSEDRIVATGNAERLRDLLPESEVEILEGAGHAYHSEVPELSSELVLDFVRRHRGST